MVKWIAGSEPVEDFWAKWDYFAETAPRAYETAMEVMTQKWVDAVSWWLGGLEAAVDAATDWWLRGVETARSGQAAFRRFLEESAGRTQRKD